jgi:hypothetical protein
LEEAYINIVLCLVENQNYRAVIPKELGKVVSVLLDTKPVAERYSRSNKSIIAFQGVTMSDSFAVHMERIKPARWS